MKKVVLVILFFNYFFAFSQNQFETNNKEYINELGQKLEVRPASNFVISSPVLEPILDESTQPSVTDIKNLVEAKDGFSKKNINREEKINLNALPQGEDPIWQKKGGKNKVASPVVNVDGASPSSFPPDPSGAASSDFYVQAVNRVWRIYDKSGSGLGAFAAVNTIWPGVNGNVSDPIVLYDKHADRWFISIITTEAPFRLLAAVSQTNDPRGDYFTYEFLFDELPDYPKYSIWWDGYYFALNDLSDDSLTCGVLNREKMLTGDPTAEVIVLTAPNYVSNGLRSILPSDADGELPPNGSPCYFFNLSDDYFDDVEEDGIKVYKMTTDFNNPSNTTLTEDPFITTSPFSTRFRPIFSGEGDISQPGTSQKLDALHGIFSYRIQHRVWATHNSLVICNVVDVNGFDHAGIRWYELRQEGGGNWTLYQEGTYAPDDQDRFLGSIAMDDEGNIALGYSIGGENTFPSIGYTGRYSFDPLGEMTLGEGIAAEGLGSQAFSQRFGDYSHMSIDPDGYTFWHTAEYLGQGGAPRTRIYSFRISNPTEIVENPYYKDLQTQIFNESNKLRIMVQGLKDNERLTLDIFDSKGKLIDHVDVNPTNQQFNESINISNYSEGIYLVRYGNVNFQEVEKVVIAN